MPDFREPIRRRLASARIDPRREAEIVDELAQHLEERHAELVSGGAHPDQAAARALDELDASDALASRLARVTPRAVDRLVAGGPRRGLLSDAWRDLRYAARALRMSPAFTLVTLLSLALGIGASTAFFQLLDAIHLRALPVAAPDELVTVRVRDRSWAKGDFYGWHPDLSYPLWEVLRGEQRALSRAAAWADLTVNLSPSGQARWSRGFLVTGDFFPLLGVRPQLGRLLSAADDRAGCGASGAVVSDGFWRRELGGDPGAIGRTLTLDGKSVPIVGVTPPGFFGPEVGRSFDFALPMCMEPLFRAAGQSLMGVRESWWLSVIGRLAPGWSVDRASAHLAALSPGLMAETIPQTALYTADDIARYEAYRLAAYPAANGISSLRQSYTAPLIFLLCTAGIVLLIACANLANLLLARATAREREIAVRLAIGASPRRLVRQLLTESLLLAAIGAALGLLLARGLSGLLVAFLSTTDRRLSLDLDPDLRVLGFTAGLAALTCVLFGLVPALHAARTDVGLVLKTHALSAGGGRSGLRRALVAVQVALSFVLLVAALLFAHSFRNLATGDTGFRAEGVLTLAVDLRPLRLPADRVGPLRRRLLERVRQAAGVDRAAEARFAPLAGSGSDDRVWLDGVEPRQIVDAFFNSVSPGYFETMGSSLLAGRDFRAADGVGSTRVAIIGQTLSRRWFGGASPLGRRFRVPAGTNRPETIHEIVGLVSDSKYWGMREQVYPDAGAGPPRDVDFVPLVYLPAAQDPEPVAESLILVRSSGQMADVVGSLRRAVAEVAPAAIIDCRALDQQIGETLTRDRLLATLSSLFGLLAALLAGVGLYGVIAYSVARRRHEIGIRMALGATRRRISAMFLGEAMRLLVAGLAAGVALSLAVARAAESLLYGLAPRDPLTFAAAGALMAAITCLASVVPAWRAAAVDPMTALREE
ncbi:MAG TPA: ABC transporter permease [Kofleriaceae bacterium]|nr:ABC transporter permease [Kofleriaceae bacterium]